jgi:Asp/Glu/hydantoin racemase
MVGLKEEVARACGEGVRVIDPVESGVEVCKSLVRLGMRTSKVGMYASS